MSTRYYGSPTLHLRIGRSRLRARLLLALCLPVVAALWLLAQRGYPVLACLLAPPLAIQLWTLRVDPAEGLEFGWRQGDWYLLRTGEETQASLARRAVLTPWVAQLVLRDVAAGRSEAVLVYVDSVPAREWRRLRARLTLHRA